ncbi:extensin family protein [Rubrimonas cliftonensis]|uniref:Uncharacterized conserved protein n=1 Tax=Rubrimonas cliftonensis TaxID=89524 RepID=A0A1H4EV13_9RHOB|nr:extensin family protein [Rubrimonas cliftonensis]SEA88845.1 Uncharacterized conserved protein [Rubrimonas cliftonensis]
MSGPRRGLTALALTVLLGAFCAPAGASPVPTPRPGSPAVSAEAPGGPGAVEGAPAPRPRPARAEHVDAPAAPAASSTGAPAAAPARRAASDAPKPAPRPASRPAQLASRTPPPTFAPPSAGGLCGDARLQGQAMSTIDGTGPCGVANPVRLQSAAGVKLTRTVIVGCAAARALADWLEQSAAPAARSLMGGRLAAITPFAGYACRSRNSRVGARLSEHAFGRAIDVGAFTVAGHGEVSVLEGWGGSAPERAFLRRVWRDACGPFGTVLGPQSDRFHRNHFHLDVADYRSGPYCR